MFRAVPKDGFDLSKIYKGQLTRRTPSNVPYLVDNIWEWLRPEHFPSRRFSAYASPTPEFALDNASAVGTDLSAYLVCEVQFNQDNIKLAHIPIKDAKFHKDISKIMRTVMASLGKDFSNMDIETKALHSALFMPAVSKKELNDYFNDTVASEILGEEIKKISTFWQEAATTPQNHDGELFFEVSGDVSYTLKPISL